MLFFTQLFRPAIFLLNGAANVVLGLFGLKTASESERVHSTGELSMLISHSTEYGVLDKSEEEMLKGGRNAVKFVGRFHMREDPVHETLDRVSKRLNELGVAAGACGGSSLAGVRADQAGQPALHLRARAAAP